MRRQLLDISAAARPWARTSSDGIRDPAVFARFRNVIEEGKEPVVIALRDRIVLVVVAVGAFERSPSHAIPSVRTRSVTYSTRYSSSMIPPSELITWLRPKPGGDALIESRIRQQVAGQLLR